MSKTSELEAAAQRLLALLDLKALAFDTNGKVIRENNVPLLGEYTADIALAAQALREKAAAGQGFEEWWEKWKSDSGDRRSFAAFDAAITLHEYGPLCSLVWQAATLASAAKVREMEAEVIATKSLLAASFTCPPQEAVLEKRIAALEAELAKSQQAAKESFDCFQDAITTRERYRKERDRLAAELAAKNEAQDICGICHQSGADKMAKWTGGGIYWPGEYQPKSELVHAECETSECARAHAQLSQEQRDACIRSAMRH